MLLPSLIARSAFGVGSALGACVTIALLQPYPWKSCRSEISRRSILHMCEVAIYGHVKHVEESNELGALRRLC